MGGGGRSTVEATGGGTRVSGNNRRKDEGQGKKQVGRDGGQSKRKGGGMGVIGSKREGG